MFSNGIFKLLETSITCENNCNKVISYEESESGACDILLSNTKKSLTLTWKKLLFLVSNRQFIVPCHIKGVV